MRSALSAAAFLACLSMFVAMVVTGVYGVAQTCVSLGGTCAASCVYTSASTHDCGVSDLRCCVSTVPASLQAGQLTHSAAMGVISFSGSNLCADRVACVSLTGVLSDLMDTLRSLLASVGCANSVSLVQGTDTGSGSGWAGSTSGSNGRRVVLSTTSSCTSSLQGLDSYDASLSRCVVRRSSSGESLALCYRGYNAWAAYLVPAGVGGCGVASAALWSDVLSAGGVRFTAANIAALDNAIGAAGGDAVTAPNGGSVCLDARVAVSLIAIGSSTTLTVVGLASGSVHAYSRHQKGRAVDLLTSYSSSTLQSLSAGARRVEYIGGSVYSMTWGPVAGQSDYVAAAVPYSASQCSYSTYSIFDSNTLACFAEVPFEYFTTDFCAFFTSVDYWSYIFYCLRLSPSFDCFWYPTYASACRTETYSSYGEIPMCNGVTYASFMQAVCIGMYNSVGRVRIGANSPSPWSVQSALSASTSESVSLSCSSGDAATSTCYATGQRTASLQRSADDYQSSATVYNSYGVVSVQVVGGQPPSSGTGGQSLISGVVILLIAVVAGLVGSAGWVYAVITAKSRAAAAAGCGDTGADGIVRRVLRRYAAHRVAATSAVLVCLMVAGGSLVWAQTKPRDDGSYTALSPQGVCSCVSPTKGCTTPGVMPAAAAFNLLYVVGVMSIVAATVLRYLQMLPAEKESEIVSVSVSREAAGESFSREDTAITTSTPAPEVMSAAGGNLVPAQLAANVTAPAAMYIVSTGAYMPTAPGIIATQVPDPAAAHSPVEVEPPFVVFGRTVPKTMRVVAVGCVAGLGLLSFALVAGGAKTCGVSSMMSGLGLSLSPVLQDGAILRIVEFVLWGAIGGAMVVPLRAVRAAWTAERELASVAVVGYMAAASTSSMKWALSSMTTAYISPLSVCSCRSLSCASALGMTNAASAFFAIGVAVYVPFAAVVVSETSVFRKCSPPAPTGTSIVARFVVRWYDYVLSRPLRLWRNRIMTLVTGVALALCVLLHAAVLASESCGMTSFAASYGLVFALMALLLVIVQSWCEGVELFLGGGVQYPLEEGADQLQQNELHPQVSPPPPPPPAKLAWELQVESISSEEKKLDEQSA